ncbi:hypothetical protein FB451DRAFT_1169167 [Mycena latifolia]|nr:hypothetical protein FB451DRAFT_1169167 [Mycena latifolia]
MTVISGHMYQLVPNGKHMVDQALEYFSHFDDPDLECGNDSANQAGVMLFLRIIIPQPTAILQQLSTFCKKDSHCQFQLGTPRSKGQSIMLTALAWMKWRAGDYLASQEHAYESRRLARISGNFFMEAQALRFESICWCTLGGYNQSIHLSNRARYLLGLCAISGGGLDMQLLSNLAEVHLSKSEYVDACSIQTQILHAAPVEKNQNDHASTLLTMAQIDVEVGALRDGVHRDIDKAKQLFNSMGYSIGPILCDMITAALHVNQGDLLKAMRLFQTCVKSAWRRYTGAVSYCLERLGNARLWVGMDHASSNWAMTFLVHCLKVKQRLEIHKALQFLGDVYLADGDQQTATSLLTVALEGFTKMDVHRSRAECMLRLGDIAETNEDLPKAAELWKTARPLFERSSQVKQVAHIDKQLIRMSHLLEHHPESVVQLSVLNAPVTCPETADAGDTKANLILA